MVKKNYRDLEPNIYRQRLVIEGKFKTAPKADNLSEFLVNLSEALSMTLLYGPIVKRLTDIPGYEAILIWAESGCQLYTWDEFKFFTLDIYTCKKFDPQQAIKLTENCFEISELVWKEV